MTAHPSKDSCKFELPNMLSYRITWEDADYAPQLPSPRRGPLARVVAALGARLRRARARHADATNLAVMSDGELADMSISRSDVHRLFDSRFAEEYRWRGTSHGSP